MKRPHYHILWTISAALAIAPCAFGQELPAPYAEVLTYGFSGPRTATMTIEAEIRAATPEELRTIETKLLTILASTDATTACKDWVCRQLRQAGSERSVSALVPLVADKDLATVARWALQSIPGPKVDKALRDAACQLQGDLLVGVVCTIGARRDCQAVPLLAPLTSDEERAVVEAALYALGQIGNKEALAAVQAASAPDCLKRCRFHAMLLCAERMANEGQSTEASAVYRDLYEQSGDVAIQIGALRGILTRDPDKAPPLVAAALTAEDTKLRSSAAKFACELGGAEILAPVLSELSTLPKDVQTAILRMVNEKATLPAVLAAADSSEEGIRVAALGAIGRLGDESVVPRLLPIATAGSGSEQAAARKSLQQLRGTDVDRALVAVAQDGETAQRIEAIRTLAARNATFVVPALLDLAEDAEQTVRIEAIGAVGAVAGCQAYPRMLQILTAAESEKDRGAAEKASIAIGQRTQAIRPDWAAERVLTVMPDQCADVRCALLRVLATIQSDKSLDGLREAIGDTDASVRDTAVRGLVNWPDAAPIKDLLELARSSESQVHKVLALRGVTRMAVLPDNRPAPQNVKLLADAINVAARPEEKKLVLGALAEIGHPEALELALGYLSDESLEAEAAAAVVKIAKSVQKTDLKAAGAAIRKVLEVCKSPTARQLAESSLIVVDQMVNIATQGTATSPDDLDKDGTASGDQAAIDGNQGTYWDEENNQPLYRLVITFKQPERIAALSIIGYGHHDYAPKDFEVVCDGKAVKKIESAQYDDNFLVVSLQEVTAKAVELKITGYYGASPAVRELGIYRAAP